MILFIRANDPLSICSFVSVVDANAISVLSWEIVLTNKASLIKLDILFWKKLYLTENSPEVYPRSCKSLTGSISITGNNELVCGAKVDSIPTSVVWMLPLVLGKSATAGVKPLVEGSL